MSKSTTNLQPSAKEVCVKVIGARMETQKRIDYYNEKIAKLKMDFKSLKSKVMNLIERHNINQPIVYMENFHIKKSAEPESRIIIGITSAYSYPTVQNDHIVRAVNDLNVDDIMFVFSKLQKKELNAFIKKQRENAPLNENGKRKRIQKVDISTIQLVPSKVLEEAIGTKLTSLIRKSKSTLKVKDEKCIPKKCLNLNSLPHELQNLCTSLVEMKQDRQKYEDLKLADKQLLENYEKKYENCLSTLKPTTFEEKILNKNVKIVVDTKTTNIKLTSKIVKTQFQQIAHTVPGFDDKHAFTPTMAKEWCSNKVFKQTLIDRLIQSIYDWRSKSGTVEEKRLNHKLIN